MPLTAQLPETGRELYEIGCAKCHGSDGRGVDPSLVAFSVPLPDFTDCRFASREASNDWIAITHLGGPARGFNSTMPSYAEAFDAERIERIIAFMRGFCADRAWPRGDLNLPLPLVTEKAFPEDEAILTTSVDLQRRGNRNARGRVASNRRASMGPRSRERGNLSVKVSSETGDPSFNGAALSRARK